MLKIDVPLTIKKEDHCHIPNKRPTWKKANFEDIEAYTSLLDQKMSELSLPSAFNCHDITCKNACHSIDRDSHVVDVLFKIIETSFQCIPVSKNLSGDQRRKVEYLHGWKENVLPFKK